MTANVLYLQMKYGTNVGTRTGPVLCWLFCITLIQSNAPLWGFGLIFSMFIYFFFFTLRENKHGWVNNGSHMYWGNFQVSDSKSVSVDISELFLICWRNGKTGRWNNPAFKTNTGLLFNVSNFNCRYSAFLLGTYWTRKSFKHVTNMIKCSQQAVQLNHFLFITKD